MTIQEKLYKSFLKNSSVVAVESKTSFDTYGQLLMKFSYITEFFVNKGSKNKKVALLFSESKLYIYGMLGLLFSKIVFLPLDITHPIERIIRNISSTDCNCMLIDKNIPLHIITCLNNQGIETLYIEDIIKDRFFCNPSFDFTNYSENDDVYLYFTSGSTGDPKAVIGVNKSLLHFVNWEVKEFSVNNLDVFAQITSPAFDPYLRDILVPLCSGAKIKLMDRKLIMSARLFGKFLHDSGITFLHTTPTIVECLLRDTFDKEYFKKLKYLILAGEILEGNLVRNWYAKYGKYTQIVNLYGPTETTLAKFFSYIPSDFSDERAPVGKPIDDTVLHIVKDDGVTKCEEHCIGEIYIETEYMTNVMYLNKESLYQLNGAKNICYATGDIGYCKDGNLYIIGRKDDQKKIAGIKINLSEIKNAIMSYSDIGNCVVLYKNKQLICIYEASKKVNEKNLRKYLQKYLLSVHIPSRFINVKNFPITTNGKVDKNFLANKHLKLK